MKYCIRCGKTIRDQAKFCPACGAKNTETEGAFKFCEECGEKINADAKYCFKCGTLQGSDETEDQTGNESAFLTVMDETDIKPTDNPAPTAAPVIAPVVTAVPVTPAPAPQNADEKTKEEKTEKDEEETKSIRCPQCGSTDVEIISGETAKCKHCGTAIDYGKPKTVYNNTTINVKSVGGIPVSFYKVGVEFDKKQFKKEVFTYLTDNKNTPVDVLDSKFSEVSSIERKVIIYKGQANMSYSATVGIDRREEYYEYENGKKVTKYRTVTDWHPTSGTFAGEYTAAIPNGEIQTGTYKIMNDARCLCAEKCAETTKSAAPADASEFAITQSGESTAKEIIEKYAESDCHGKITGDHVKDFSCSSFVNIVEIKGYIMPEYTIEYEHENEEYAISSFAAGKFTPFGNYPNQSKNIDEYAHYKNLLFSLPAFIMLIVSTILSFTIKPIGWIITLCLIATALFTVSRFTVKGFRKNIVNKRQDEKRRKLTDKLAKI
ncbi:MAG TPA: hypothetical protein DDW54_00090 [Clostridiales bacterium]|nr:hypothetical protein [Clostridiales bacterium]